MSKKLVTPAGTYNVATASLFDGEGTLGGLTNGQSYDVYEAVKRAVVTPVATIVAPTLTGAIAAQNWVPGTQAVIDLKTVLAGTLPMNFALAPGSAALPAGAVLDPNTGVLTVDLTVSNWAGHIVVRASNAAGSVDIGFDASAAQTAIAFDDGISVVVQGNVTVVRHVDGPARIVSSGQVTILSVSPATVGVGAARRNGHVLNPQFVASSNAPQPYDGRRAAVDDASGATFPLVMNPGDVLLPTKSTTADAAFGGSDPQRSGYTDAAAMIYVDEAAGNADAVAPAAVGWSGRGALQSPSPVDYAARAAALPVAYGVAGAVYPTQAEVKRALRFNPFFGQRTATEQFTGYESYFPTGWGRLSPSGSNWNYGRDITQDLNRIAMALIAPLAQVPLATKAEILLRLDSFAAQTRQSLFGRDAKISGDGAHQQFIQFACIVADWLRGAQPDIARYIGNWEQAYVVTDQDVLDHQNGFGDANLLSDVATYPDRMWWFHWRKVTAVNGLTISFETWRNSGTGLGDDQYPGWSPARIVRQSDGAIATVTAHSNPGSGLSSGTQSVCTLTLSAQPATPIAVGDAFHFRTLDGLQAGQVIWRERLSRKNSAVPTSNGRYQSLQYWSALMVVRAMGWMTDAMKPAWSYFLRACLPNDPVSDDFSGMISADTIVQGVYNTHLASIVAVPQPFMSVPADTFYPTVPAFDLTAAAGSMAFPEGNNGPGAANLTTYKGALIQSRTNIAVLPASTSPWATFAIVRLPKDKRAINGLVGIMGHSGTAGNTLAIKYTADLYTTVAADRRKFRGYNKGGTGGTVDITSPEWTEDSALVVFFCDGASNWQCDWYSLATGQRFAGTPAAIVTGTNALQSGTIPFTIGGIGNSTAFSANGGTVPLWPGEIDAVGIATTAITPAQWQAIALGADIITTIGAANLKFVREFDGTAASYAKPAAATGDTSSASTALPGNGGSIPDSTIMRGSTFRRQSTNSWISALGISHGWVYGLKKDETSRLVPFVGAAASSLNGQVVEVQIVEAVGGRIVRDWVPIATVTNGLWSGSLLCPRGEAWWIARVRCGGVIYDRRDEFSVGHKILLLGQSQMSLAQGGNPATSGVPNTYPMTASYVTNDNGLVQVERLGMGATDTTGLRAFVNQWRYFDPLTPIMLIDEAVNGTTSQQMIDDTEGQRLWSNFQAKIDWIGTDLSVIVINWGTAEAAEDISQQVMADRWNALFFGTGPLVQQHSMTAALATGWVVALSPLTRHTQRGHGIGRTRMYQVQWANDKSIVVGPPVSDMQIEAAGGPHQNVDHARGSRLLMQRLAVAAAKGLGLTAVQNPYFTTVTRAANVITVNVALPNGGALYSPAPSAVLSFDVNETGATQDAPGVGWTSTGFTAAIVGNTIRLTKTSGNWAAGTVVRYWSELADRADNDSAAETLITSAALYETWAGDVVCGLGLPLLGGLAGGKWVPDWQAIAA